MRKGLPFSSLIIYSLKLVFLDFNQESVSRYICGLQNLGLSRIIVISYLAGGRREMNTCILARRIVLILLYSSGYNAFIKLQV